MLYSGQWAKSYILLTTHAHYAVILWPLIIDETNQKVAGASILERNHFTSLYRTFFLAKSAKRVRVLYDRSPHTSTNHMPDSCGALDVLSDRDARFALKADLRDRFFHLPVHKTLNPFLVVDKQARVYLSMGLATTAALMQTVMVAAACTDAL